ncbi:elongation factor 1-beta [Thermoplasma acidophilum]|uniref:Elongation factor 1-beta n=1 Tax=Thermoplasma acidophilum (strain ATCC 25905 / DSM 1728 / JCM 9062 / NBRC 15155 / AMRC-C165) TaxID=273075 RepID=EF1B_THEAC|nr:elongation factor 1-beta [Thermoplasma acidophilum]Q9HKN1.2 RecName: Full=Elongation factor 1-beta; Short=EF-1-beta [Thermoplasma acidophilum DSM 1728]
MGDVLVTLKILPKDTDADIKSIEDQVKRNIEGLCSINRMDEVDIGFGLKYIKLEIIVQDKEGEIDRVENSISSIEGVGEISTENVSLI